MKRKKSERSDGIETRRKILEYIIDYKKQNDGLSPSLRKMSNDLGIGFSSVKFELDAMEKKGMIIKSPFISGIRIPGGKWSLEEL